MCHGTPFSSFLWRDIAPVLASRHRIYVWDMLGYGQSDHVKAPELDTLLPDSRLKVLPGTGHLFKEDAPAASTAELLGAPQEAPAVQTAHRRCHPEWCGEMSQSRPGASGKRRIDVCAAETRV